MSEGLSQLGIAVLLFDRRGNGASTGSPDVAYETLAEDGVAGARLLRTMPQIDAKHVDYSGVSQGADGRAAQWPGDVIVANADGRQSDGRCRAREDSDALYSGVVGSVDPVSQTEAVLKTLAATHDNISYAVIPDANHLMMVPPVPERMADAGPAAVKTEMPESPAYFMLLGSWLTDTVRKN